MSDDHVKRLRDARKWLNNDGQCCGQVDSVGTCAAPACIFGEALKEFYQAADLIEAQAAEIARLRAACDASDERARAIELRFWQTVDRDGLTGLPSDMWAALKQLVQDRAELATARRDAMEEATQAPREIAMGHGLVDVCVCNHEGRYGLVLKPRAEYAPIGQETAPARSVVTLDGGCVVVWFDGPEFAGTIIEAIQEAAAIRATAREGKP